MGMLWVGYGTGLWGYCLIRGYDIPASSIWSPKAWYTGKWPPPLITDPEVIFPQGAQGARGGVIGPVLTASKTKHSAAQPKGGSRGKGG